MRRARAWLSGFTRGRHTGGDERSLASAFEDVEFAILEDCADICARVAEELRPVEPMGSRIAEACARQIVTRWTLRSERDPLLGALVLYVTIGSIEDATLDAMKVDRRAWATLLEGWHRAWDTIDMATSRPSSAEAAE
jgi:hypothetical protein